MKISHCLIVYGSRIICEIWISEIKPVWDYSKDYYGEFSTNLCLSLRCDRAAISESTTWITWPETLFINSLLSQFVYKTKKLRNMNGSIIYGPPVFYGQLEELYLMYYFQILRETWRVENIILEHSRLSQGNNFATCGEFECLP